MENIIYTKDVVKTYGTLKAVDSIGFEIKKGETMGFIGPNGAGKTTIMKVLMNFIFKNSGTAKVFGLDVEKDSKKIKQKLAFMSSEDYLYQNFGAKTNVMISATLRGIDKKIASDKFDEYAKLLDLNPKKPIKKLSKGNKRKASLIKLIVSSAELLILDEPTVGLDPLMQQYLFEILVKEKKAGKTIFFSSHILTEIEKFCDRVIFIKSGKITRIESLKNSRLENDFANKKLFTIKVKEEKLNKVLNFCKSLKLEDLKEENKTISFLFENEIELLTKLAKENILNDFETLNIEKPSIESFFLKDYKTRGEK